MKSIGRIAGLTGILLTCGLCASHATELEEPIVPFVPAPAAEPVAVEDQTGPTSPTRPTEGKPSEVEDAVEEILSILKQHRLSLGGESATQEIIVALARVADPAARLLEGDHTRQLENLEQGLMFDVGLHLTRSNRTAIVTGFVEGSPAAAGDIKRSDVLVEVGGEKAASLNIAQLTERLRGLESEAVELMVQTGDDEPRTITLEKKQIQLSPVEEIRTFTDQLGYIRVNGLFKSAGAEIVSALLGMIEQDLSGVVIDLRGADGRDVQSAVDIASMMATPRSTLFSFRDAEDRDIEVYQAKSETPLGMPVMILVDQKTTGAAELLAAVLSGAGRGAMLIGRPTAGDPVLRDRVPLKGGQLLYLATRRLVVAGGITYSGRDPVTPDIVIDPRAAYSDYDPSPPILTDRRETTEEEIQTHRLREEVRGDAALTRAVDVLLGLKALNIRNFSDGNSSKP